MTTMGSTDTIKNLMILKINLCSEILLLSMLTIDHDPIIIQ